jgi:cytochrome c
VVRSRKIQAEAAVTTKKTQVLNSDKAQGGRFMGAIQHGGYLKFPSIPLDQVGGIRVSVASAGAGGKIDFRLRSRSGPVLCSIPVAVNGNWEEFYQVEADISEREERADVFVVFVNRDNREGLMNVDWIEFLPRP